MSPAQAVALSASSSARSGAEKPSQWSITCETHSLQSKKGGAVLRQRVTSVLEATNSQETYSDIEEYKAPQQHGVERFMCMCEHVIETSVVRGNQSLGAFPHIFKSFRSGTRLVGMFPPLIPGNCQTKTGPKNAGAMMRHSGLSHVAMKLHSLKLSHGQPRLSYKDSANMWPETQSQFKNRPNPVSLKNQLGKLL